MQNSIESYMTGIYGWLQLAMQDVGLLDEKGQSFKGAKYTFTEQDAIRIYQWVGEKIQHINADKLRRIARESDQRVNRLINNHKIINNFLLAIMLLRHYLDDIAPLNEQLMILPKVNRLVDVVDSAISDEEFSSDIKRTTARTAQNIYRQWAELPMLSDEVFDAKFKGITRRNNVKDVKQ